MHVTGSELSPGHHLIVLIIPNSLKYRQNISNYILVQYDMHSKSSDKYLYNRDGVYQFIRRIPVDLSDHYGSSRIQISLKIKNISVACKV